MLTSMFPDVIFDMETPKGDKSLFIGGGLIQGNCRVVLLTTRAAQKQAFDSAPFIITSTATALILFLKSRFDQKFWQSRVLGSLRL